MEKSSLSNQIEIVHLLQDISLEKFGLHNFLEHLDLFLFQFKGTEYEAKIQVLRDYTYDDYQQMKVIMDQLNQEFEGGIHFNTSIPTDEKEENGSNVKVEAYSNRIIIHRTAEVHTSVKTKLEKNFNRWEF